MAELSGTKSSRWMTLFQRWMTFTRPRSNLMAGFTASKWKPSPSWPKRLWVAFCPCWTRKCMTRFSATAQERIWGVKLGPPGL